MAHLQIVVLISFHIRYITYFCLNMPMETAWYRASKHSPCCSGKPEVGLKINGAVVFKPDALTQKQRFLDSVSTRFIQWHSARPVDYPVPGKAVFFRAGMKDPCNLAGSFVVSGSCGNDSISRHSAPWNASDNVLASGCKCFRHHLRPFSYIFLTLYKMVLGFNRFKRIFFGCRVPKSPSPIFSYKISPAIRYVDRTSGFNDP